MKARFLVLAALLCVLGLAACAGTGAEASTPTPPPLHLRCNGSETQAMLGSYSWTLPGKAGSGTSVQACGQHPLACRDESPLIQGDTVSLLLEGDPNQITVQRWDADAAHEGNLPEGEEMHLRVNIIDGIAEHLLDLEAGNYCYAVTLDWEEPQRPNGSASYYFHTAHPQAGDKNP